MLQPFAHCPISCHIISSRLLQGSLSRHLFDYRKLGLPPLMWHARVSIALDIARGMEYLHSLAHASFVHRDLKPANVLLTEGCRAKVADFGLVKVCSAGDGLLSLETRLAGTFGYMAPEYAGKSLWADRACL